jgi:tetratricopeptide (TPR) repeat protein
MSLLLEALKKAEKAKEEAQRRARGDEGAAELRIEPDLASAEPKPVTTRAELPDIKQPLEILSDDIAPKQGAAPDNVAVPPPAAAPRAAQPQAAERAAARKVFEAKFKEPNPRLPFYITMGVLGLFAVCTVAYFWYQLRPPPALVNVNPARGGEATLQVAAAAQPASPAPAPATQLSTIPGLPPAAAATPPAAAPAPAAQEPRAQAPRAQAPRAQEPRVEAPAPRPRPAPRPPAATPAPEPQPLAQVSMSRAAPPQVHPKVAAGYAAYQSGDLVAARTDYENALREDGGNRDALLGLAAIDVRSARYENAEAIYLRLLQIDPNDAHAQAGLIALRGARLDPLATESRVKNMLAADPGANVLHFTLGNQLAQQGRWPEAQQEYFKAFAASPENADFAYNLAVSLDHVRQAKLALEYYRRAIALAERRGASFNLAAARARASQLEK